MPKEAISLRCPRKIEHLKMQDSHVLVKFWFYLRYISKQKIYTYIYIHKYVYIQVSGIKSMFMLMILQYMLSIQNGAGFFGTNSSQIWARCF